MMPLSSWLDCSWRHNPDPRRETVASAARALDDLIWRKHRVKLLYCDDADRFREISTAEVVRANVGRASAPEEAGDYPQLGTHADPTCRHLTSENFFSLIGTKTDRPLPLYTMNTAALYPGTWVGDNIADLFTSRRLWSDHPERDCADLAVTSPDKHLLCCLMLPAVHLGTAWTNPKLRGKGIMTDVSRLHRMVAWLRWPYPQFATVVPDSGASKVFGGRDIGAVIEARPTHTTTSRVLFWDANAAIRDADAIAAHGIATAPN